MAKKIEIKIPKPHGDLYLAMHIPEEMGASELLKIIEANELTESNIHSGLVRIKNLYRDCGELENKTIYNVHTSDPDKTVNLIRNYNHSNSN